MGAKRKMRRPSTRRRLAQRWLDSGLTAREFASVHGVSSSSLHRWATELRAQKRPPQPAGFIEVASATVPAPAAPMSVRLVVGNVSLELDQLPPTEYVLALGGLRC